MSQNPWMISYSYILLFQTLYIYIVYLYYGIAISPTNISNMGPGFSLWCGRQAPRRLQNGAAAVFGLEVSQWTAGPCWADWLSGFLNCLVVWNMVFIHVYSPYVWNNHPNWLIYVYIFFRGVGQPPTSKKNGCKSKWLSSLGEIGVPLKVWSFEAVGTGWSLRGQRWTLLVDSNEVFAM